MARIPILQGVQHSLVPELLPAAASQGYSMEAAQVWRQGDSVHLLVKNLSGPTRAGSDILFNLPAWARPSIQWVSHTDSGRRILVGTHAFALWAGNAISDDQVSYTWPMP